MTNFCREVLSHKSTQPEHRDKYSFEPDNILEPYRLTLILRWLEYGSLVPSILLPVVASSASPRPPVVVAPSCASANAASIAAIAAHFGRQPVAAFSPFAMWRSPASGPKGTERGRPRSHTAWSFPASCLYGSERGGGANRLAVKQLAYFMFVQGSPPSCLPAARQRHAMSSSLVPLPSLRQLPADAESRTADQGSGDHVQEVQDVACAARSTTAIMTFPVVVAPASSSVRRFPLQSIAAAVPFVPLLMRPMRRGVMFMPPPPSSPCSYPTSPPSSSSSFSIHAALLIPLRHVNKRAKVMGRNEKNRTTETRHETRTITNTTGHRRAGGAKSAMAPHE